MVWLLVRIHMMNQDAAQCADTNVLTIPDGDKRAGAVFLVDECLTRSLTNSISEKLNLAVVGVGSRGTYLAGRVQRLGQNLVALCDVDRRCIETWRQKAPDIPCYQDFCRSRATRAAAPSSRPEPRP